jgi:DNA-binding CsgD family transcriptional regulator
MADSDVDALALTTEALGLVGPEPTALRAKLLSIHAITNANRQRVDEAMRWAGEAVDLARDVGLPKVVLNAATTLARLEAQAGDPENSRRTFERIVAQARADGDVAAELRGLNHLGALHYELGRLGEATEAYAAAWERAVASGSRWAPFGLDARLMGAIAAYTTGRWDDVVRMTDMTGESPPGMPWAALASADLAVRAGRGDTAALEVLPQIRAWWDRDGFIAILSGAAAIDLHGDAGDLEAALRCHDDIVEAVRDRWQVKTFLAQVRLGALVLGHLAHDVSDLPAAGREELLRRGDAILEAGREAVAAAEERGRVLGPEGRAWVARAEAEHLRLRWRSGIMTPTEDELLTAWERTVPAFEEFGHEFEVARSRSRLAVVLRSLGRTSEARALADPAREVAHRLGAQPLLAELRAAGATAPRADAEPGALTPREQEILVLVADGRSNGEIAKQLFISAKTVSVHVSNILAKLGAGGRTEAAALARRRGLLD